MTFREESHHAGNAQWPEEFGAVLLVESMRFLVSLLFITLIVQECAVVKAFLPSRGKTWTRGVLCSSTSSPHLSWASLLSTSQQQDETSVEEEAGEPFSAIEQEDGKEVEAEEEVDEELVNGNIMDLEEVVSEEDEAQAQFDAQQMRLAIQMAESS